MIRLKRAFPGGGGGPPGPPGPPGTGGNHGASVKADGTLVEASPAIERVIKTQPGKYIIDHSVQSGYSVQVTTDKANQHPAVLQSQPGSLDVGISSDAATEDWQDGDFQVLIVPNDAGRSVRGGLITVNTDSNGQATVTFPEPFPSTPAAILLTPKDQLVSLGTLVLTASYVTIWAWDIPVGGWATNRPVNLYWMGLFS